MGAWGWPWGSLDLQTPLLPDGFDNPEDSHLPWHHSRLPLSLGVQLSSLGGSEHDVQTGNKEDIPALMAARVQLSADCGNIVHSLRDGREPGDQLLQYTILLMKTQDPERLGNLSKVIQLVEASPWLRLNFSVLRTLSSSHEPH